VAGPGCKREALSSELHFEIVQFAIVQFAISLKDLAGDDVRIFAVLDANKIFSLDQLFK
jgi:hypothetical protein